MPSERNTFKMSCDMKECSGRKAAGILRNHPEQLNHQETELLPTLAGALTVEEAAEAGLCTQQHGHVFCSLSPK